MAVAMCAAIRRRGRQWLEERDDKRQFAPGKILLIRNILIARKQQVEFRLLGRVQQRAVLQSLPAEFIRPHYLMSS